MNKQHLKWLNLWRLGEIVCKDRGHTLVSVTYCTAYHDDDIDKKSRHKTYIEALAHYGVKTVLGHYMKSLTDPCGTCGTSFEKPTEKQTDINFALSVFSDGMKDRFDWAYILSADSDQTATARFMKEYFPEKKIVTVSPPNKDISKNIANFVDGKRRLNEGDIEKARMPSIIMRDGLNPIRCPYKFEMPKVAVATA